MRHSQITQRARQSSPLALSNHEVFAQMKKLYESPEMIMIALRSEEIMTASDEEQFDIEVSFDQLWNA